MNDRNTQQGVNDSRILREIMNAVKLPRELSWPIPVLPSAVFSSTAPTVRFGEPIQSARIQSMRAKKHDAAVWTLSHRHVHPLKGFQNDRSTCLDPRVSSYTDS